MTANSIIYKNSVKNFSKFWKFCISWEFTNTVENNINENNISRIRLSSENFTDESSNLFKLRFINKVDAKITINTNISFPSIIPANGNQEILKSKIII